MNPVKGFNSRGGGSGGPKIHLPLEILIDYIARGYHITDITKFLLKDHGFSLGKNTVSRWIIEYFGGLEKARELFLRPVLEELMKEGYNSNDITEVFGTRGRNIVDRIIPQLFDSPSFREARRIFLIEILEDLIIEGLGQTAMADRLQRFGLTEIDNAIKEEWGSLKDAQKFFWRPIIIQRFKDGWNGKDILISLGYAKSTVRAKHDQIFARLFWGMSMSQVEDFAKSFLLHPLDDTEI